jgi:glycosyltransferase involved in cell wall biosynthesis
MFCSTIIPTIGRPTLARAVRSALDQQLDGDDFEVIVVNDSAQPLPIEDWQSSPRVRVAETCRRERSVARNTGAAMARGRYFHFLDDDDWLLPGAHQAIAALARGTQAIWLFGAYQAVDNQGALIREFRPDLQGNVFAWLVAGEAIPFQASWLEAKSFFAAGGFDPQITGPEDRDLGRRLALAGDVARTDAAVARIRVGEQGSTTVWSGLAALDRYGREKALRETGAFSRLRASARTGYWRGRVARAYLASTTWNLRRRRGFTALSRAASGLAIAGWHTLTPGFWHGLRTGLRAA